MRCVVAALLFVALCHALPLEEPQAQTPAQSSTKRACVLNDDNTVSCLPSIATSTDAESNLSVASRPKKRKSKKKRARRRRRKRRRGKRTPPPSSGGRGSCAQNDVICWSKKTLALTNALRRKHGVRQMLVHGTQAQMNNAMKHAKYLARIGYLKHQVLRTATAEVKCKRFISGENLAWHYEKNNVAGMCMQLWITSRGHFLNLVRDWFKEMVMGVYIARDGRVYCVQTFALYYPTSTFGRRDGPLCHEAKSVRL